MKIKRGKFAKSRRCCLETENDAFSEGETNSKRPRGRPRKKPKICCRSTLRGVPMESHQDFEELKSIRIFAGDKNVEMSKFRFSDGDNIDTISGEGDSKNLIEKISSEGDIRKLREENLSKNKILSESINNKRPSLMCLSDILEPLPQSSATKSDADLINKAKDCKLSEKRLQKEKTPCFICRG